MIAEIRNTLGDMCRNCTIAILGGLDRSRGQDELERDFDARPAAARKRLMVGTIGLLAACAYFAAQWGLLGIAIYLGLVFLLIR